MNILVTGATGFIGGAITRKLSALGHRVIATGRSERSTKIIRKYADFQQWNICDKTKNFTVDVCIHSAALADDQSNLKQLRQVNVKGTENVIKSVQCRKFIFISSSSVYNFGLQAQKENNEININKLGNYGRTKREAELLLLNYTGNFDSTTVLRPRAVYGIGDRLLVPRLIEQVKNNSMTIPGNLNIKSSLCSIDLLTDTVVEIINKHSGVDAFNVVDSHTYIMRQVFKQMVDSFYEKDIQLKSVPLFIARPAAYISELLPWKTQLSSMAIQNLTMDKVLSNEKLVKFLDYNPKMNYKEEVDKITDWYREVRKITYANLAWTKTQYESQRN